MASFGAALWLNSGRFLTRMHAVCCITSTLSRIEQKEQDGVR